MVLLEVKLFRPCLHIPRGIQNKPIFITECKILVDTYDTMKTDDEKNYHIIKIYTVLSNYIHWFMKVINNKKR